MKRTTITLPADLAAAVEVYRHDQEAEPTLTAVAQAALREYLTQRGYLTGQRTLTIRPAEHGSGAQDTSEEHDHYLTAP